MATSQTGPISLSLDGGVGGGVNVAQGEEEVSSSVSTDTAIEQKSYSSGHHHRRLLWQADSLAEYLLKLLLHLPPQHFAT